MKAIYQAKIIVDPKWTDVTKSEFDNYVELGGFDTRVVYAAPTAGQWVHCSPSLLNAGVSCANTPRRACECEGNTGHDHFIAHSTGSES